MRLLALIFHPAGTSSAAQSLHFRGQISRADLPDRSQLEMLVLGCPSRILLYRLALSRKSFKINFTRHLLGICNPSRNLSKQKDVLRMARHLCGCHCSCQYLLFRLFYTILRIISIVDDQRIHGYDCFLEQAEQIPLFGPSGPP